MKKGIIVVLFVGLISGSVYCHYQRRQAEEPLSVEVTTVKHKDIYNTVVAPGRISESGIYHVVFATDTKICEVAVSVGETVDQGDVLMKREHPKKNTVLFSEEIGKLTNQIVSAVSEYGIVLENSISIPTVSGDEILIRSPANGVVSELNVSENELVEGFSVAAQITDYDNFRVTVDLSEIYLSSIEIGQYVEIFCDAFPEKKYKGHVLSIANAAKRRGNLISGEEVYVPIEISVENADESLKPGYSVTVKICTEKHENTLSIPYQCIVQDRENRELVYVVNDGVLELRRVLTGLELDRETEILYGLKFNEKVVKNPSEDMKTGKKVMVSE